ncbi:MAG: pyridoxamine 5'-phosphate oxidase [Saprospiraceae bacterium]|nr:pyridoxamine 5'-phosphate oxidase [Saprospiraceae bacterium]
MKSKKLSVFRKSYTKHSLLESAVELNPYAQFTLWFKENLKTNTAEPNAMVLATADKEGRPSSRIVLLKEFGQLFGFRFFTNYHSRKAEELKVNPRASLLFYWPELERQVRLEGKVKKLSRSLSDEYFQSRPRGSQLGAWTSEQSKEIPNRQFLDEVNLQLNQYFKPNKSIPLPPFWGGFSLIPDYFEFWQGREDRLHDRIIYRAHRKKWVIGRLAP